jgi:hypothetical protein
MSSLPTPAASPTWTRGPRKIPAAAARTAQFWDGHLDLEALAWETTEHLRDITIAAEQIDWATVQSLPRTQNFGQSRLDLGVVVLGSLAGV